MTDPISFTSGSPRFGLPLLFAGQAQKEFYVNEAFALADMLLHPAVEGEAAQPPAAPSEGECWLVGPQPSGPWMEHAGAIASLQGGTWVFAQPQAGMRIFDKSKDQQIRFDGTWRVAPPVMEPAGGTVIDVEARGAVSALIAALVHAGILPQA